MRGCIQMADLGGGDCLFCVLSEVWKLNDTTKYTTLIALQSVIKKDLFKCFKLIHPYLTIMNLGMFSCFVFLLCNGDTFTVSSPLRGSSGDSSGNWKQTDYFHQISNIILVKCLWETCFWDARHDSPCSFFNHFRVTFGLATDKFIPLNTAEIQK